MMTEVARVLAVEPQHLWVETLQKSTCNSCTAQKGCGYGLMNEAAHQRRNHLRVAIPAADSHHYQLDDKVELEFPEQLLVSGAMLVYLLPLLTMLAAGAVASLWFNREGLIVLASIMGLALGFALVWWRSRQQASNVAGQVKVRLSGRAKTACAEVISRA
ncbi:SoxR reducing system RseC family protein [Dasania sp. GY-MA-18]|uniref:SoxR reducing system RseC family protein n=1 Tax=Dasania phycosphaerae TaxID=2950436 RepID=A0A9J6RMJ0_9GAMM|nr:MULTISPECIES: SoxR reducing system RseC family protein [Dasania]MCR8923307.1 SoxR reducing system RseC family protein [Dasania sp. GY-MA-18]MCZ0865739.1 SoxR reducing system RseC family protein [Dasania phycosphaerae]MCZ0869464.1 SoxR reducing system RseC family protein [Dasania phycosphaerae]